MAPEMDLDRLLLIAGGHSAFQLLWAGVELDLYTFLSDEPGATRARISEAIGIERQPTRILLTGLVALGVLVKEDGGFRNAATTEEKLVRGRPGYAAPILGWQAHIVYPGMQDFVASLRENRNVGLERFPGEGGTIYERLRGDPDRQRVFHDAMSALSGQANAALLEGYDLGRFEHLVDAGGGDGTNAIAMARRFPDLRVTVFDNPSVCALARANIEAAGLSDRVGTHEGDFFRDAFPADVDAVLLAHIVTIWSMETNAVLFRRVFDALATGGSLLVFGMMGNDEETGPISTALGSPYFLAIATGQGMLHSFRDYEDAMTEVGFAERTRVTELPLDHGLLVGTR